MTDRELLQQALDALKVSAWDHIHAVGKQALIDAIIDRLAQPDAEPVAWAMLRADGLILDVICPDERESYQGEYTVQLYAAPPAAPAPAVPLTREQQIAIREAHCNTASDEYFGARPQVGDVPRRRIYEAGFKEGWEIAHGIGGGGNG